MPLDYTEHPGKNWGLAILPLSMGGRGWPESGEASGAPGRGKGRARLGAHLWRRGGRGLSGGGSGELGRQHWAAPAAAAWLPARRRRRRRKAWLREWQ
jgi:hypothetical protein